MAEAQTSTGLPTFDQTAAMADQLVESAISQLRTPIRTPVFSGVNMGPLNRENARLQATREETQRTIEEERARYTRGAETEKAGAQAEGEAIGRKAIEDQRQLQRIADDFVGWFKTIGLSPDEDIGNRLRALPALKADADAAMLKVRDMQSVGLFDNPLEWAFNQIQLPSVKADYNARARRVNSEFEYIQQGVARVKEASELSTRGITTTSIASAQAEADRAAAAANIKKGIIDRQMAIVNVNFSTQKFSEDLSIAQMTKETTALQLQASTTAFQQQLAAIQIAENRVTRELRAAELVEKLGQSKSVDVMLAKFDQLMGNAVGTTSRAIWQRMPEQMKTSIAAVTAGSYGTNLLQFYETVYQFRPGPNFSPETTQLFNWTREQLAAVQKDAGVRMVTDPNQKRIVIGNALDNIVKLELANPSRSRIFRELTPQVMIQGQQLDINSPIGAALSQIKDQTNVPPTLIVSTIGAVVGNNPNRAGAAIAEYYSKNIALRNETMNLRAAGVRGDISSYPVSVNVGLGSMMLDLTKPAEATKFFILQQPREDRRVPISNPITR